MNEEQGRSAPEDVRSGEGTTGVSFAPPGGPGGVYQYRPGPYPAYGYPAAYGGSPGFGQNQPNTKGRGLAIAALCVAGFGLLFSWIWFLNFIAYLAGILALGLGIPALVKGSKAKNIALPLSITAVSSAVVSMIVATIINLTVQYGAAETGTGYAGGGTVPGPMRTAAPLLEPSDAVSGAGGDEQATELPVRPGLPDRDYSADISGTYFTDLIAQPAASAGESVQVGDYKVTLTEVDRDATAEVLERDPSAGEPTHGYVIFEFSALYNGSPSGTGRPDLDFTPKFVGADARMHSVLNCSLDLGAGSSDRPALVPGGTGTYEICFDLPEAALGEDSRVGLRMVLAERSEDVWWRLQ